MINVMDAPYNAAGDGETDDWQAIQDAIDDAKDAASTVYAGEDESEATGVGEIVLLPKGTYLTTAPLKLPPTVTLQGEGTGTLLKSVFDTEPPVPYDIWRGAVELTPDNVGYVRWAGVKDLSIFTNTHCAITYDREKEVWPLKVFTYQNSAFTDVTDTNKLRFREGQFTVLTGSNDYLYIGTQAKMLAFWARMKQLGFSDAFGSRLNLVWEYSSGVDGSGNVNAWSSMVGNEQFLLSDEGGGFWNYGHNGLRFRDPDAGWVQGKVNNSASMYWVRVRTTSTIPQEQRPIAHHVYPGATLNVNITCENLYFNCGNWAIFFGLFCYCQHCTFRGIRTVNNNGGCIWVVGNSNYIMECDTEGGSRSSDGQARTDPGQFTMEGAGNTIRDVIAEGGGFGKFPWYCFRGENLVAYNLWVEGGGIDTLDRDRIDCNLQELQGAVIDRPIGHMRLENARNIVIGKATAGFGETFSDFLTLVGDSTLMINDLWGYFDPGDMDNPRIRWGNFHSFSNRGQPLLPNTTSPLTGNLTPNGDFRNGTYGWTISVGSGTTAGGSNGTVQDALHERTISGQTFDHFRGKELVIDIADETGNGIAVSTTLNIPPEFKGYDAFVGFRADIQGNCQYIPELDDNGVASSALARALNSQTAYRIRKIGFTGSAQNTTHTLKWKAVTSGNPFSAAYKYDGTTFTAVDTGFQSSATILNATGHQFYLGADLPVNSFHVSVQTASSNLEFTLEYWDGSQWSDVNEFNDGTTGLTTTGTISFSTPREESTRWKKRTISGTGPFYWVRFTATQVTSPPTISNIARNRKGKLYLSNVYCVIGQVHNQVPSMHVQQRWGDGRLEISASSLPSTGTWKKGDLVWKTDPSIVSAIPNYHLMGWRRMTDGQNHTLNTDWVEMRVPTGQISLVSLPLDEDSNYHVFPSLGEFFGITLSTSGGTIVASNGTNGQRIVLRITQDGGGNTVSWGSIFRFGSDIPSANLSTADDKYDYVTCIFNSANNKWDVVNIVRGFSV